jgi:membrane-associated phospholipid phosphatase
MGEGWALASAAALAYGGGVLAGSGKAREAGAVALQALAVSGLMTAGLKEAFGSVRPSTLATEHRFADYGRPYGELSFPSGHSYSAFAAAEVFGSYYGRYYTYPLAVLIAYSRVYEGAHWPSDVAFGALCGVVTARFSLAQAREQGPPTLLWAAKPLAGGAQLSLSTPY